MEIKLDPEVQAIVDAGKAANPNPPPISQVPVELFRAGYVMIGQTQATQGIACDQVEDIEIPGPAGPIPARTYAPTGSSDAVLPGLIYIHGGGFTIGNLDSHDSLCRQLSNSAGVRVIALDYRLAPEHKYPAAIEDCLAASEWIFNQAADLKLDPARIAMGGDSAGGNLTAVLCNHFASEGGPQVKFQLLIYPATDRTVETPSRQQLQKGVTLDVDTLAYFDNCYLGGLDVNIADPRLSPALAADHSKVPPAHIITAEYDPLRDEGKAYADLLNAAGVSASYQCYDGMMHNFIMQTGVVSRAHQAVEDISAVLKQALI